MRHTLARPSAPAPSDVRRVGRRTVARGAAWTAPVAMVSVAVPAYATSGGSLKATWTEARYSGADGKWAFCFAFSNSGGAEIKVTSIQTYTTYHSPAVNAMTTAQLVDTVSANLSVKATNTAANPAELCTDKHVFGFIEPTKSNGSSYLPEYYNDFPQVTDGKIDCVAKNDRQSPPVYPGDPAYPDSCRRLGFDATFVKVNYTVAGSTFSLTLPMGNGVGCRVTAGCK